MYSNVIMAFNTPHEDLLRETSNILYGEHYAMYPRELQGGNCFIVGSFLYSHRDMQGKRLMEFLSHLRGYHMKTRWKSISTRPEEGKEILRMWHVEIDEKDKNASYQIPGIHVQHKSENIISPGIQTTFPLRCERLYWDPWNE
jgi:hypothetical protein